MPCTPLAYIKGTVRDYCRYVENALREALGFEEIPLRLRFRGREEES